ncbi:hypothetical protein LDZ77_06915 [Bacteroides xylanisolvens]|uniref:Uncharacterized protein n=1 Tax=Bacteroides xylanisolvens TaxID=371601 RepID=A0AAW4SVE8_9BACE|nr:SwmB domain-containing protein [Bacteroides xylanisolvens]MCA4599119.1 hypothetical protein [Bacteroides xylanisolvens]MCA4613090.1 hypothetical protein [Bacteroides xylanisolvens]MCA4630336.1 hypothetical protein [Bacteroides xylanisolvens]MCA4635426.1 hypothetical protein [Bacteroides xylanisolvens]MCA4640345.1 hypothetical protein [Bacteroides xylanisolvens]
MIKLNKYLPVLVILLGLIGCEKDYMQPSEFSDVSWYFSSKSKNPMKLSVGKYLSFMDLSQGELSHSWKISEGGNYFLKGHVSSEDTVFDKYIVSGAGLESTDKTVRVLFTKPGLHTVRLYNTFKDEVTYRGADTLVAKKAGDIWVVDTTFTVDVYDKLYQEYEVYRDESLTDLVPTGVDEKGDTLTINIEAGGKLYFVDRTVIDRPTGRTWKCDAALPATSSEATAALAFNKLGMTKVNFTSNRDGENIPFGYAQMIIPLKINVIKSSIPYKIQEAKVLADKTVQLVLNGEVNAYSLAGKEKNFTVHVENGDYKADIAVESLGIDETNKTVLKLKLSSPIYNTDVLALNYTNAEGNILSMDERDLGSTNNLPIEMYINDLCADAAFGFEEANISSWSAEWDNEALFSVENNIVCSGNQSLKVDTRSGLFKMHCNKVFSLKKNVTYRYTYKVLISEAETTVCNAMNTRIMVPANWGQPVKQFWQNQIKNFTKGEWSEVVHEIKYDTDLNGYSFHIQVIPGEFRGVAYFDDFSICEYEVRPLN